MMGSIGIINYGMGNIQSVANALNYLGEPVEVVETAEALAGMSHVILPGVGAFPQAMKKLRELGFTAAIRAHVAADKPFLGICLGMQLLADEGDELGLTAGLGLVPGRVERLEVDLHIPHVGWNNVTLKQEHPLFKGVRRNVDFYFVHSYHFVPRDPRHVLATTDYGKEFVCAVTNGRSAVAFQFHPEKSQDNGLKILENFCAWDGRDAC